MERAARFVSSRLLVHLNGCEIAPDAIVFVCRCMLSLDNASMDCHHHYVLGVFVRE